MAYNMPSKFRQIYSHKPIRIGIDILLGLAVAATLVHLYFSWHARQLAEANVCRATARSYQLTIRDDSFSRSPIALNLCDSVTITNLGRESYLLTFGKYNTHQDYPGFTPQVQAQNESITFDALEQGNFTLHDHVRDRATLSITIGPKK